MESEPFIAEITVMSEPQKAIRDVDLALLPPPQAHPVWYVEPGGMVDVALKELGAVLTSVTWDEEPPE